MSNYQQLIVNTFLKPIRSVLVIDDEFPSYDNILACKDKAAFKTDNAIELFKFYQNEKNLLCSFECPIGNSSKDKISTKISNTDLLILDYHLNPKDDRDSSDALDIIKKLAWSPSFNLIIVYSSYAEEEYSKIIFEIFLALKKVQYQELGRETKEFIDNNNDILEYVKSRLSVKDAISYLCDGKDGIKPLLTEIEKHIKETTDKRHTLGVVKYAIDELFLKGIHNGVFDEIRADVEGKYITGNGVFICIAGKKDTLPGQTWTQLENSLKAWMPHPVNLTLHGLLNELKGNAPEHISSILSDENTVNGWVTYAKPKAQNSAWNITALAENLMSELSVSIIEKYFSGKNNSFELFPDVKKLIPSDRSDIFHALNKYLCSYGKVIAVHLTTGIILFRKKEGNNEYWLVLNCSCDLVPEQDTLGWRNTTQDWLPYTAVKLIIADDGLLCRATDSEYIFIRHGNNNVSLRFRESSSSNPHYEVFYAEKRGLFTQDKKINAHSFIIKTFYDEANKAETKTPALENVTFEVIAQLRYEYACRFLQMLVSNKGRIGVDFVSLPKKT